MDDEEEVDEGDVGEKDEDVDVVMKGCGYTNNEGILSIIQNASYKLLTCRYPPLAVIGSHLWRNYPAIRVRL